ncbi:MAG: TlpA disulfide reductase family protein [Syntrophales bacterium]|nr:TlpA disulfide reductase family protein [Syntrophales bacterium]
MTKRHRVLLYATWGFIFLLSSLLLCADSKSWNFFREGIEAKAPDFVLKDLKGQQFKLSDHKGIPVLLIFTTTWCSYCRAEIPHFKDIYATYGKRGLVIVNIDIQESQERVSLFAAKYRLPYRTLLDKTGDVANVYDVRGVPTMILINREGNVVCWQCRSVDTLLKTLLGTK